MTTTRGFQKPQNFIPTVNATSFTPTLTPTRGPAAASLHLYSIAPPLNVHLKRRSRPPLSTHLHRFGESLSASARLIGSAQCKDQIGSFYLPSGGAASLSALPLEGCNLRPVCIEPLPAHLSLERRQRVTEQYALEFTEAALNSVCVG
ncbi:unnamed protein product [Pleuronectes platessa]|uniref:Uncharacterized protein n=1 Tax=Pleuronectes platessa TaxID=8262 RepID=A0A9N7Z8T7_PLEPL|nr:unnamed protein product [Pleuronectes platessa]